MEVNGREYPFWGQFVEKQTEWIGGILEDFGDSMDKRMGFKPHQTMIKGIELSPNGDDSAFFSIIGKDFECGFDVGFGGITSGEEGWITFNGYQGHKFRIKQP